MLKKSNLGVLTFVSALYILTQLLAADTAQCAEGEKKTRPGAKKAAAAAPKPATKTSRPEQTQVNLISGDFGKGPTYIKSESLILKPKERLFIYSGGVEIKHQDMILSCDDLQGAYDEKNEIKEMTALKNVLITKGDSIQAHSEKAIYESTGATLTLTDNPEIQQNGSILTADKIRIFLNDNRSVAEGAVRVKMLKGADFAGAGKDLFRPPD